jgi:integrase
VARPHAADVASGNGEGVESNLRKHVLPVLGRRPLSTIRRADVERLYASLALAPSTVGTVHQHLTQLLSAAVEDGLLPRNPAKGARLPKVDTSKAQPVPLDVVDAIAEALPVWVRVAVPLGVGVGLRQGEATGLVVSRVDFLRRRLQVTHQLLSRAVDEARLGPPKTGSSYRTIPLADFVIEALADHLHHFRLGPTNWCCGHPAGERSTATGSATSGARHAERWACRACGITTCGTRSQAPCCHGECP